MEVTFKKSGSELNQWLKQRGVIMMRLSEQLGVTPARLSLVLSGASYVNGKAHRVTEEFAARLTKGLHSLADGIGSLYVEWGTGELVTRCGRTYDPSCVQRITALKQYFNVKPFLAWALGWSETRSNSLLYSRVSKVYGNITKEMCDQINEAVLALASQLKHIEVMPDPLVSGPKAAQADDNNISTRAREEEDQKARLSFMDTTLPIPERLRLLKQQRSNCILLFRVDGGHTVAQEDAEYVHRLCPDIRPYTDYASGITTAFINAETLNDLLPRIISDDKQIAITDMYGD